MGIPKPLWRCPDCDRTFANTNQSHSCGTISPLEQHFSNQPLARKLFDATRHVLNRSAAVSAAGAQPSRLRCSRRARRPRTAGETPALHEADGIRRAGWKRCAAAISLRHS